MSQTTIDEVFFRLVMQKHSFNVFAIEDYGVKLDMLDSKSQKAAAFVESYRRSHNEPPDDRILVYEIGWTQQDVETFKAAPGYLANEIKTRYVSSALNRSVDEVINILKGGKDHVFDARQKFIDLADDLRGISSQRKTAYNLFSLYPQVAENYEKYKKNLIGMETPFPTITEAVMGYQPGDAVCWLARPGTGKSWQLLLHAKVFLKANYRVLLVEPELTGEQVAERFACIEESVPYPDFIKGRMDDFLAKKFKERLTELSTRKGLWMLEDNMEFDRSDVEYAINQFDPDVILIDSMYLLGEGPDRAKKIENASPWVKRLANTMGRKRLCIATSQMNRDACSAEKMTPNNIYGSDAIYQDFDLIYGMYQDDDMYRDKTMGYYLFKMRRGTKHPPFFSKFDIDEMDFREFSEIEEDEGNPYAKKNEQEAAFQKDFDWNEDDSTF